MSRRSVWSPSCCLREPRNSVDQVSTIVLQSFCRSWISTRSLETALTQSAITSLRWCCHCCSFSSGITFVTNASASGSVPAAGRLLDARLVHCQTFGAPRSLSPSNDLLPVATCSSHCAQVGAVDSSYDAHDDMEITAVAAGEKALGGSAALTVHRLQGRGGDA